MANSSEAHQKIQKLLNAYKNHQLGNQIMPEDTKPVFKDTSQDLERRLVYFTLPMSLNYQRDSYKLWEACLKTYNDKDTADIFSIKNSALMETTTLRKKLTKHKIALQPNKHIHTWKTISETVCKNWKTLTNFFNSHNNDFLQIKQTVQIDMKKQFPYLSGPKIFNYWSWIMCEYGKVPLKNTQFIDIAPDTHVIKSSVKLGVITELESKNLSRDQISQKWRELLKDTSITPIQMHAPLWFWSRNGFEYTL